MSSRASTGVSGHPRALVLLLLSLLLGAACGTRGPGEPTTLQVVISDDWARAPAFLDAVREFEASRADIRVEVQSMLFEDIAEAVRSAISRGSPPDVAQWHAFAAGAEGMAEPLDDVWRTRLDETRVLPGAVEDVTWAGHRYGVPLDTNAMLIIYDSERFAAAGAPPPGDSSTFADLKKAATALAQAEPGHRMIAISSSTWHTYGWIRANGGRLLEVDPSGRVRFTFEEPAVVEAVDFLSDLVREGLAFAPTGLVGDRLDAFEILRSGKASMHVSGSWDLASLRKEADSSRYRVSVMPKGVSGTTVGTAMGGSSLFVPKGARQRTLAIDFMLLLTSDRYALRLVQEEGRLPVRHNLYDHPFFQSEDLRTFLRQLESADPFKLEAFPRAHEAFAQALDEVLISGKGAGTALREAQQRADATEPLR
jgi:multiple sugar transport system substrate-binding protein